MSDYHAAVIGTGKPPNDEEPGYSIGYAHGRGYQNHENCEVVACADIVEDNARQYAQELDIDDEHVYDDYLEMLATVEPDIVSVCTPPQSHAPIVVDCARQGAIDAIHCEKPMAVVWPECGHMVQECERRDIQLTFNHQRRFHPRWRTPKERIDDGLIGDVVRIEMTAPDLLDWGTHCFDLCGMYSNERPAEWVIGQINEPIDDAYDGAYEHHTESQAFGMWEYDDGVVGIASTGEGALALGEEDVFHRIRGTEGVIEIGRRDGNVRYRQQGDASWTEIEFDAEGITGHTGAIDDVIRGIETGSEPSLSGKKALNATEIIFGIWESARRRGRVDLPLTIDDNPLESMIERGDLSVRDTGE